MACVCQGYNVSHFLVVCRSLFLNLLIKGLVALSALSVFTSALEVIFEAWLAAHLPENRLVLFLKNQVS